MVVSKAIAPKRKSGATRAGGLGTTGRTRDSTPEAEIGQGTMPRKGASAAMKDAGGGSIKAAKGPKGVPMPKGVPKGSPKGGGGKGGGKGSAIDK